MKLNQINDFSPFAYGFLKRAIHTGLSEAQITSLIVKSASMDSSLRDLWDQVFTKAAVPNTPLQLPAENPYATENPVPELPTSNFGTFGPNAGGLISSLGQRTPKELQQAIAGEHALSSHLMNEAAQAQQSAKPWYSKVKDLVMGPTSGHTVFNPLANAANRRAELMSAGDQSPQYINPHYRHDIVQKFLPTYQSASPEERRQILSQFKPEQLESLNRAVTGGIERGGRWKGEYPGLETELGKNQGPINLGFNMFNPDDPQRLEQTKQHLSALNKDIAAYRSQQAASQSIRPTAIHPDALMANPELAKQYQLQQAQAKHLNQPVPTTMEGMRKQWEQWGSNTPQQIRDIQYPHLASGAHALQPDTSMLDPVTGVAAAMGPRLAMPSRLAPRSLATAAKAAPAPESLAGQALEHTNIPDVSRISQPAGRAIPPAGGEGTKVLEKVTAPRMVNERALPPEQWNLASPAENARAAIRQDFINRLPPGEFNSPPRVTPKTMAPSGPATIGAGEAPALSLSGVSAAEQAAVAATEKVAPQAGRLKGFYDWAFPDPTKAKPVTGGRLSSTGNVLENVLDPSVGAQLGLKKGLQGLAGYLTQPGSALQRILPQAVDYGLTAAATPFRSASGLYGLSGIGRALKPLPAGTGNFGKLLHYGPAATLPFTLGTTIGSAANYLGNPGSLGLRSTEETGIPALGRDINQTVIGPYSRTLGHGYDALKYLANADLSKAMESAVAGVKNQAQHAVDIGARATEGLVNLNKAKAQAAIDRGLNPDQAQQAPAVSPVPATPITDGSQSLPETSGEPVVPPAAVPPAGQTIPAPPVQTGPTPSVSTAAGAAQGAAAIAQDPALHDSLAKIPPPQREGYIQSVWKELKPWQQYLVMGGVGLAAIAMLSKLFGGGDDEDEEGGKGRRSSTFSNLAPLLGLGGLGGAAYGITGGDFSKLTNPNWYSGLGRDIGIH